MDLYYISFNYLLLAKFKLRAASKGLEAAMELKRLRCLSPATARQLYTAMVVPTVDYASNVCTQSKTSW